MLNYVKGLIVGSLITAFTFVLFCRPSWPIWDEPIGVLMPVFDAYPSRPPLGYQAMESTGSGDFIAISAIEKAYKNMHQREHLLLGPRMRKGWHILYSVQHKSVRFVPPVDVAKPPPVPPLCGLPALVSLLKKGGDAAEWVGDGPPAFRFKPHGYGDCAALLEAGSLDRRTLFSVLKGERIVFSGDSMVRQMFLRTIDILRNDRPQLEDGHEYIEHYFHVDAYYAASAEKDVLLIGQSGLPDNSTVDQHFPDGRSDIQFEILFVWDPKPESYSHTPFLVRPTVIIGGYFYWWQGEFSESQINPYLAAMRGFLQANPDIHYFNVPVSWAEFEKVPAHARTTRNRYIDQNLTDVPNADVLDFAAYADIKHFEKTKDGLHYTCAFRKRFPFAIDISQLKSKPRGCLDPINRNWAVILLSSIAAVRQGA